MTVKPKSKVKNKSSVKSKSAVNPNKMGRSKQSDFSHLSEDIISNVGVGIYIVQNGKFVYVSPLFQKLSGYSYADLAGTNPLDYLHPDDREVVRKKAIKSLKGKSSDAYEYRFTRKNGEVMWVLEMITSITYKGKRAALGSFMDITERKKMEETIHQSGERYRTILESTQEGYFENDLAGNFTFVNDAMSKSFGYIREELIGMNNRQYTDETTSKKMYKIYNRIYKTGEPVRAVEGEYFRKDGTKGFNELSISLIRDLEGKPIGFRGIARDVTERKRAEEALRQSEEKYRAIIENIEDGYFEIDLDGNFTFFNESLCEIHGYPKEELMGMNNRKYADKENAKKVFEAFSKIYKTGKTGSIFDYEIIRKDGTKRQVEVSASLRKDSSGNPIGFRGITRDVTERKQEEETIRHSEERYRTILDEMEDAYFEVDLAGNFTFVNDADLPSLRIFQRGTDRNKLPRSSG